MMVTYVLEAHLCAWEETELCGQVDKQCSAEVERALPPVSSVQTL